jgi:hypothetical protein
MHTPLQQLPPPQLMPQALQLAGSLLTSTQAPPQQVSPPQLTPQSPQLAGSVYGSTQIVPH